MPNIEYQREKPPYICSICHTPITDNVIVETTWIDHRHLACELKRRAERGAKGMPTRPTAVYRAVGGVLMIMKDEREDEKWSEETRVTLSPSGLIAEQSKPCGSLEE